MVWTLTLSPIWTLYPFSLSRGFNPPPFFILLLVYKVQYPLLSLLPILPFVPLIPAAQDLVSQLDFSLKVLFGKNSSIIFVPFGLIVTSLALTFDIGTIMLLSKFNIIINTKVHDTLILKPTLLFIILALHFHCSFLFSLFSEN